MSSKTRREALSSKPLSMTAAYLMTCLSSCFWYFEASIKLKKRSWSLHRPPLQSLQGYIYDRDSHVHDRRNHVSFGQDFHGRLLFFAAASWATMSYFCTMIIMPLSQPMRKYVIWSFCEPLRPSPRRAVAYQASLTGHRVVINIQ